MLNAMRCHCGEIVVMEIAVLGNSTIRNESPVPVARVVRGQFQMGWTLKGATGTQDDRESTPSFSGNSRENL
jgi:hypothetical protein